MQEIIQELTQVQDTLREAAANIRDIQRKLRKSGHQRTAEVLYRYISGHLEVLIDSEHSWLDSSTNIQNIIEELSEEEPSDEA
jgi:hypothetical protein